MAKENQLTGPEKDLLIKMLTKLSKRMEKVAIKASDDGEKHIAAAAMKQKEEVDALMNKIL